MNHDITVHSLGDGVEEATLADWLKDVGEQVAVDEPIAELMTDKVSLEIVSPVAGILTAQHFDPEDVVTVGAVIAHVEEAS